MARITRVLLVLILVFLMVHPTRAAVYMFIDDNGTIHFTNVPVDGRYVKQWDESGDRLSLGFSSQAYDPIIQEMAARYGVDFGLVKAVIRVESNFNPWAISRKGAQGLMQLMPETASLMRVGDVYNPRQNIEGGVRYLRSMLDRFQGDLDRALAAYNAGPTAVAASNGVPPIAETIDYVRLVKQYWAAAQ